MEISNRTYSSQTAERMACLYRWTFTVVNYSMARVHNCCRLTTTEKVSVKDLTDQGTAVFANSANMKKKRLNMLSGIRDSDCGACWSLEDSGARSARTEPQDLVDYLHEFEGAPNSLEEIVSNKEKYTSTNHPNLELQIDNICDLKCIYCWPEFSSRWESEFVKKYGHRMERPEAEHLELFQKTFWQWFGEIKDTIRAINFVGGEPSVSETFYSVGNRVYESVPFDGERRVHISICSNFNATDERFSRFFELIEKWTEKFYVSIEASCEAPGKRAEFIRRGLKWDQFEKNFARMAALSNKVRQKGGMLNLGLHMSHNFLSIASLPEYIKWAHKMENDFSIPIHLQKNVVSTPRHLSPFVLPPDFSKYLFEAAEYIQTNHRNDGRYGYDANWVNYRDHLLGLGNTILSRGAEEDEHPKLAAWMANEGFFERAELVEIFPEYRDFFNIVQSRIKPESLSF